MKRITKAAISIEWKRKKGKKRYESIKLYKAAKLKTDEVVSQFHVCEM